ncbi:hypothetical protein Pmani_025694 [Petrolisthes manimaculis]|uniref:Uncharacterized protein n=1 Tax=Petrolisthes manimaculis TaxID=1843537 RepID=A0AAE1P7P9_9EUCA|nr:hypothetical protein Pmani_025694 [Petrolisthes manimaculis]
MRGVVRWREAERYCEAREAVRCCEGKGRPRGKGDCEGVVLLSYYATTSLPISVSILPCEFVKEFYATTTPQPPNYPSNSAFLPNPYQYPPNHSTTTHPPPATPPPPHHYLPRPLHPATSCHPPSTPSLPDPPKVINSWARDPPPPSVSSTTHVTPDHGAPDHHLPPFLHPTQSYPYHPQAHSPHRPSRRSN